VKIASARAAAFQVLFRIHQAGGYANLSLEEMLRQPGLKPEDRRLATELVNGAIRYDLRLDYVMNQYLSKGNKGLPAPLLIVIKLALYQLMFSDRIPAYAVINDAVEQTKELGLSRLKGLTNAVLRAASRTLDQVVYPDRTLDFIEYLSVYYSHPRWLVERWLNQWGSEYTERLLAFNNTVPPVTLRVNTLKIDRLQLQQNLLAEGVETSVETLTPWALKLVAGGSLTATRSFQAGHFYIQDEGSMLIAAAVEPQPGQALIDACAGVGGKSTMLAQLMNDQGKIIALELYDSKIKLLEANCLRLGVTSVQTWQGDMLSFQGEAVPTVLLDAPCSGLGVLRRRADARYRRSRQDIKELAVLQARLLEQSAVLTAVGGMLV